MKSTTINALLLLAMAAMAIAAELPGDPTSATATVTVTEQVCMSDKGGFGDATPLSIANALATAADDSAAASLIASMITNDTHGGQAAAAGTTTVTALVEATDCPAPPTFDLSPAGPISSLLAEELNSTSTTGTNNTTDDNELSAPLLSVQRWSQGRNSLCFTNSDFVATGKYAIYLDGWGQEKDGCGKGALDNLRGHCGLILFWQCKYWGKGVLLTFYVSGARYSKCVLDAMWAASPHDKRETGLCCVYVGSSLTYFNNCDW